MEIKKYQEEAKQYQTKLAQKQQEEEEEKEKIDEKLIEDTIRNHEESIAKMTKLNSK